MVVSNELRIDVSNLEPWLIDLSWFLRLWLQCASQKQEGLMLMEMMSSNCTMTVKRSSSVQRLILSSTRTPLECREMRLSKR